MVKWKSVPRWGGEPKRSSFRCDGGGTEKRAGTQARPYGAFPIAGRDSLLGGGVYRYTALLPDRHTYLSLVFKQA